MADGSTPEGTVEQEASAPDADALLDRFLGASDEEHSSENEGENTEEASTEDIEDADTDTAAEEADENDDATTEDENQSTGSEGYVADDAKVRLPDGTETTVAELKRGNLRESDYTRKTQEIGALRKELDQRQAALTQHEQSIDFAIEVARAYLPAKPDAAMVETDPLGYLQAKESYEAHVGQLQQLFEAKANAENERLAQQQNSLRQQMEAGRDALLSAMPELREPAKANAFASDLSKAISKYGFDPQDVHMVRDHRLFLLAKDAMAYQRLMAQKPKALAKTAGKPPLAPGKRQSPQADKRRERNSDWQKLRQSNGRDEGALDRILDDLI